jgi:hypothetical protein
MPDDRSAPPLPARPRLLTQTRVAVAVILAIAVLARLPKNGHPPLGPHDFRQTQTAITVQAWLDRGFTLLDYETPVFGPPWKVPFEFPTFQASAWVFAKAGVQLDRACRTAAILWFFASALLLHALTRRFAGERAAVVTLAVYVLSPFSLLWGRAVLIEYAAVTLALGYLLATLAWAERPRPGVAALAVSLGTLAAVTKITTVAVVVPGLVLAAVVALRRARSEGRGLGRTLAVLALNVVVPIVATALWTRWCDAIKAPSPATAWLTSEALVGWNFGTLKQRLTLGAWREIVGRLRWIVPGVLPLLVVPALATLWRRRGAVGAATAAALAGALLPILIFFNLYWVHDYYLAAVTPCLALIVGVGAAEVLAVEVPWRGVALALACAAVVVTARRDYAYAAPAFGNTRDAPIVRLAKLVTEVTPREGWVVVQGDDWSPRIGYLSRRRTFMLKPPIVPLDLVAGRPEVTTVVCAECPDVLARWGRSELAGQAAGFSVYRVAAPLASPGPRLDGSARIP